MQHLEVHEGHLDLYENSFAVQVISGGELLFVHESLKVLCVMRMLGKRTEKFPSSA